MLELTYIVAAGSEGKSAEEAKTSAGLEDARTAVTDSVAKPAKKEA